MVVYRVRLPKRIRRSGYRDLRSVWRVSAQKLFISWNHTIPYHNILEYRTIIEGTII